MVPPDPSKPQTLWNKLLGSTPVVMTVVATLLAGLSSSEMTRAQYDRSLAAQQQARVGDQWSFFQAKRQRGAALRSNLELLQATTDLDPLVESALRPFAGTAVSEPNWQAAVTGLVRGTLPGFSPPPAMTGDIQRAREMNLAGERDTEVMKLLNGVKPEALAEALRTAQEQARSFDRLVSPVTFAIEQIEKQLAAALPGSRDTLRPLWRNFTAARMRYDATRYDTEAGFNRIVAELLELQVRQSNASADRHNARSQLFFAGMLGAQLAVILASIGLAVQRRNLLWTFAALIGIAALIFGIYVFVWL